MPFAASLIAAIARISRFGSIGRRLCSKPSMDEIQVEETSCLTSNESSGGMSSPPPSDNSNGHRHHHPRAGRHHRPRASSISSSNPTTSSEEAAHRSMRKQGRFVNPWPQFKFPTFWMLLKFLFWERDNSRVPCKRELDQRLPILVPDREALLNTPENGLQVTWIGHATVLVQMDNINILTDPVFSQRASPFQFVGPKRYRNVPCTIHDLPEIHAVVISHNHYDHLDYGSVQTLNARFGSELRWFVPQGLAEFLHRAGCENVIELNWWDENCIPEHPHIRFVFTPAQHWCKRGIFDDNKVLWGSWCILGPWHQFFFAGDTGYCPVFEAIGKKFGPFDLAAIPIGAYEPRWFMKAQHVNPDDAVQVHVDIQAKKSLAIHWGTFKLSNEFYLEPREKLTEAMGEKGLNLEDFFVLQHGETKTIGDNFNHID